MEKENLFLKRVSHDQKTIPTTPTYALDCIMKSYYFQLNSSNYIYVSAKYIVTVSLES